LSEFTCKNGHLMSTGECPECGERIAFMDGESRSEILARERVDEGDENAVD
jgi:hypothetical protein